jgi:urea carboxylase
MRGLHRRRSRRSKSSTRSSWRELNGLSGVAQLVRVHSGTEYWVAALGFWPGLPFMMALDPRCKSDRAEIQSAADLDAAGHGRDGRRLDGDLSGGDLPGGYQIFGAHPGADLGSGAALRRVRSTRICLFRPGDRVRFVPCIGARSSRRRSGASPTAATSTTWSSYQKFSVAPVQAVGRKRSTAPSRF